MPTVPHVLSAADSAKVETFARQIVTKADRLNRQVVARYGMDIFMGIAPTFGLTIDYTYILYHFPGVSAYIHPFVADDERITAFENEVALRVHQMAVSPKQTVALSEVPQ